MTDAVTEAFGRLEPAPPRRRRAWPWIVALIVVVGLVAAAWFAGEAVARQLVVDTIRQQVVGQLALPADQDVDVEVGGGAIIPQLVAGTLDVVTVSSDDVPLGPTTGDVTVRAAGVPIRGEPVVDAAQGMVSLDAAEVSALLAQSPDLPLQDVRFAGTDVAVTVPFSVLGLDLAIDAVLTPQARDGALVLTPVSYAIADATFTADDLRARFGDLVAPITADRTVCLAGYLPTGLTLQHVAVAGEVIQAQFAVDPRIAVDADLRALGTCP